MDLKLQEITLPSFLWYLLPGLNFVFAVVAVPILLFNPNLILQVDSLGGIAFVALLALVAGFVMDSSKVYSLRCGYNKGRKTFFNNLSRELGTSEESISALIDAIRLGLPERGSLGRAVAFNHARWVMMTHSASSFYILAIVWFIIAITMHIQLKVAWYHTILDLPEGWPRILADLSVVVVVAIIAYRIDNHANRQKEVCNKLYLTYVGRYRHELRLELFGSEDSSHFLNIEDIGKYVNAFRIVAKLKEIKRQGWQEHGLMDGESIADHTFMVCLLAYLLAPYAGVDPSRSVILALLHDVPEVMVGDITPNDQRLSKKFELENKAARELSHLFSKPQIHILWDEVERGLSKEARFVQDLDKLETVLQASIYEEKDKTLDLGEFYSYAQAKISGNLGKSFLDLLITARQSSHLPNS